MFNALVIAAFVSIVLVSVHPLPGNEVRCLEGMHHKMFATPERYGFAACFPWQNKSCCSAELTVNLKERGGKDISHFDWDYCGGLSERCKSHTINQSCLYFCDPNMVKWAASDGFVSGVPLCSGNCDEWFEACKNDKTYSENWFDKHVLQHTLKGEIKPDRTCRTFAESNRKWILKPVIKDPLKQLDVCKPSSASATAPTRMPLLLIIAYFFKVIIA